MVRPLSALSHAVLTHFPSDEHSAATSNDPEASKVKEWRHRLQKAFLGKTVPKDEASNCQDTTVKPANS